MDSRVSALIAKTLDGLSLRSMVTAQNIASANSASYRPMRVSFEEELKAASSRGQNAIQSVALKVDQVDLAPGSQVQRLDLELETASETALRYGALIDVLGRQLNLQRTIIRGGQ